MYNIALTSYQQKSTTSNTLPERKLNAKAYFEQLLMSYKVWYLNTHLTVDKQ